MIERRGFLAAVIAAAAAPAFVRQVDSPLFAPARFGFARAGLIMLTGEIVLDHEVRSFEYGARTMMCFVGQRAMTARGYALVTPTETRRYKTDHHSMCSGDMLVLSATLDQPSWRRA